MAQIAQFADSLPGLSQEEVASRIAKGQVNKVKKFTTRTYPQIIAHNVFTIFNGILVISLIALLIIKANTDAFFLFTVTFINVISGIIEEIRAKIALDRLALVHRKTVKVIRDHELQEISIDEVVKDDLVIVNNGEQIVADGILISPNSIYTDESLLTGESDNIKKQTKDTVYSGSFCSSGSGVYKAEKVGKNASVNTITAQAKSYKTINTPIQKGINIIVEILTSAMILFIILLLISGYIKNTSVKGSILAIVTVIKSLVPQGLILMSTLSFALGAIRIAKKKILVQKLSAIEAMSHVTVMCLDKTGTLGTNKLKFNALKILTATFNKTEISRKLKIFINGVSDKNKTIHAIESEYAGINCKIIDELPFSSQSKSSAIQIFDPKKNAALSLWLGAPDFLGTNELLSSNHKEILKELRSKGLRVLLFAESTKPLPDKSTLKPLAFIVLEEELRPNIKETIKFYEARNVELKILSGDHVETIAAIAKQAGMEIFGELVNGSDLLQLSPEDFKKTINNGQFFGHLTPNQKKQIIQHLQSNGEFVAMIGDGINDILALKQADIGIALNSGASASKDVSDIILLKNSFTHLPAMSKEGDRIIYNIKRIAKLFLTKNIYSLFFILFVGFVGLEFPLSPRFITWIDFLTIGIPATFLVLLSPKLPKQTVKNFVYETLKFALIAGITISFFSVLAYACFSLTHGDLTFYAKTAGTTVIIFMDLFIIYFVTQLERKQTKKSIIKYMIFGIIILAILLNLMAIYWSLPRDLIGMTFLDLRSWVIILAASIFGTLVLKKFLKRAGF